MQEVHWSQLFEVARRAAIRVGAEDPEEVAQETLARIWSYGVHRLRHDGAAAFAATVARNIVIDIRRTARGRRPPPVVLDNRREPGGPDVYAQVDLRLDLRAAIDRLPPSLRAPLVYRAAGEPYATIAAALGVQRSTVHRRLCEARQMLRRWCAP